MASTGTAAGAASGGRRVLRRQGGGPRRLGLKRFGGPRLVSLRRKSFGVGGGVLLVHAVATAVMDLGEPADRGEVLGREPEDVLELFPRVLVAADLDQRAPERDMRGQIGRMADQARRAGRDRLFEAPGAAEFLGERREGDGRRVRLDPAFELFNPRMCPTSVEAILLMGPFALQSDLRESHVDRIPVDTCFAGLVGDDERNCVRSF